MGWVEVVRKCLQHCVHRCLAQRLAALVPTHQRNHRTRGVAGDRGSNVAEVVQARVVQRLERPRLEQRRGVALPPGRLLQQLATKPEWLESISQIDVADPYDAVVLRSDDPALLHLGGWQFLERLGSYVELAPTLREQVSEIDYVDLRFGERVYVGPADPFEGVGTRRLDGAALAPATSEWTTGARSGWSGQGADDNRSR